MEQNDEITQNADMIPDEEPVQNEDMTSAEGVTINTEMASTEEENENKKAKRKFPWKKFLFMSLSYVLVIAITVVITLGLFGPRYSKLSELESVIDHLFVGEYDRAFAEDMAARAMVAATGDRWSFYMSKEEWAEYKMDMNNSFVGIGITITSRKTANDEAYIKIIDVKAGGPAQEAGMQVGDVLTKVDGVAGLTFDEARTRLVGDENTQVTLTVMRGQEELNFTITRKTFQSPVATGKLLEGNIGLICIENFNTNCAKETIAAIEKVRAEGATALVFDVRYNPGGYVDEMVKVLDYLLPECVVFRQEDYKGKTSEERSDAACVDMPMAVLVNGDSYSAAEFFAACLREYDKAIVAGEKTVGKGYYQQTYVLSDGSAVNLSVGKYFTPKGVNLTDVGGLTPDIPLTVSDQEIIDKIYGGAIKPEEDPQLQAAIAALRGTKG